MDDLTPLSAPTARDPYPYYAQLVAERPFYLDGETGMWIASSAAAVQAVLHNDALAVRPRREPVPSHIAGTASGNLFGQFMRMRDDEYHGRLKNAALHALHDFASGDIAGWAQQCAQEFPARSAPEMIELFPAFAVARALGLDTETAAGAAQSARDFAATFSQESAHALLDGATRTRGRLAQTFRRHAQGIDDAAVLANLAGFLFQSCDATAGLIANALLAGRGDRSVRAQALVEHIARYDSPVQNTRRFATHDTTVLGNHLCAGDVVLVVIAAANRDPAAERSYTFGSGPHACPAERIAVALAAAAIQNFANEPRCTLRFTGYRPSQNLRIAQFEA